MKQTYTIPKTKGFKLVAVICLTSLQKHFLQEVADKSDVHMQFWDSEEPVLESINA